MNEIRPIHVTGDTNPRDDSLLQEYVLDEQGRNAINSWFKVSGVSRWLVWGYFVMTVSMIFFIISSLGVVADWFWPKVAFIVIVSALLSFISIVVRAMVYSGKPIPALRDDLLDVNNQEKVVTANNFYMIIVKTMLIPTMTLVIAVISVRSQMLNLTTESSGSTASLMGFVFITVTMLNLALLIYLYLYLRAVKKGNKSIEIEIDNNYKDIK